jgi:hypothetical protein
MFRKYENGRDKNGIWDGTARDLCRPFSTGDHAISGTSFSVSDQTALIDPMGMTSRSTGSICSSCIGVRARASRRRSCGRRRLPIDAAMTSHSLFVREIAPGERCYVALCRGRPIAAISPSVGRQPVAWKILETPSTFFGINPQSTDAIQAQ